MDQIIVYRRRPTKISSENPTKRHGCREDSSEGWLDLGESKPVKKFRCNELDEYTRKTDFHHTIEGLKLGQQETATIIDPKSWVQEQGEVEEVTNSRAKRIRRLYSPEFPTFKEDNSSLNPSLAAERTSSKSAECDSSASNSEGTKSDLVSETSVLLAVAGLAKRKQLNLKGDLKTHNDQQRLNMDEKDRNETGAYLELEVGKLPQSALVDVELTVEASNRAENVPFVRLTSEAYGTAILGYPLEIGEMTDGSETLLSSKESVARKLFGVKGSQFHQLVWRTSKRTPVCYATHSLSSAISKNVKPKQASEDVQDSVPPARENSVLIKEKSLVEFLKNPKEFNRGKTALS